MRWRIVGAGVVVVALAALAIWLSGNDAEPIAAPTTTTVTPTTTTPPPETTAPVTTTTTEATTTTHDPEAREEEVRLILEDLWFRWLDAVYREDRSMLANIVATQSYLDDFEGAVTGVSFTRTPDPSDLDVSIASVLRDTPDCLVVERTIDSGDLIDGSPVSRGVDVLWPHDGGWRLATGWTSAGDLWEMDCSGERIELP